MSGARRRTVLTGSPLSSALARWTQPGIVKSVQRGTFTLASTSAGTATITSVDTANAEVVYLNLTQSQANANLAVAAGRVTLTNATTVTANMGANAGNAVFSYEVMEYFPGVLKSLQRGTVAVGTGASATATVTTITTLKARTTPVGWSMTTALGPTADQWALKSVLTNTTTITCDRVTADANNVITAAYQLLEYY